MKKASALKPNWWETCTCVSRVFSKRDRIPLRETMACLDEYQKQGIGAIEIFAPYHGVREYGALDPYHYFIVDPDIGTMNDFLALIAECHKRDMALIVFLNVGYAAMENPEFLKAQDDVRRGIDSREARFFLWNDDGTDDSVRTFSNCFGKETEGEWVYSERAGKYYWVKWHGFQNDVALPQYNFASAEWQAECKKIIRFWMETGIDGVIIDAPYCYLNCDFTLNNECITDIVREYPNQYLQPEGGGAAGESLERWIEEAHYNSLQDYSICKFWQPATAIGSAILSGDASPLEKEFCRWRDRITAAGGVTYLGVLWDSPLTEPQRLLEMVTIVTSGAMLHDDCRLMKAGFAAETRKSLAEVLKLCAETPALRLNGKRTLLRDDDGCYAFLRSGQTGQQALVVLNFKGREKQFEIPLNPKAALIDAFSGERVSSTENCVVNLAAYGFAVYLLTNQED